MNVYRYASDVLAPRLQALSLNVKHVRLVAFGNVEIIITPIIYVDVPAHGNNPEHGIRRYGLVRRNSSERGERVSHTYYPMRERPEDIVMDFREACGFVSSAGLREWK